MRLSSISALLGASLASAMISQPLGARARHPALGRAACVRCVYDDDKDSLAESWEDSGRKDSLAADVERFRAAKAEKVAASGDDPEEFSLLDSTINTLGTVLTYNFFIIITFFAWFLTGVAFQFGAQQYAIINAFRSCWDFLIMPLLTTHMTLTFLSFGLEKMAGEKENA